MYAAVSVQQLIQVLITAAATEENWRSRLSRFTQQRQQQRALAIQPFFTPSKKVEKLRTLDESVDALIEVLIDELSAGPREPVARVPELTRSALVEAIAARVLNRLAELRPAHPGIDNVPIMVHTEGW